MDLAQGHSGDGFRVRVWHFAPFSRGLRFGIEEADVEDQTT